MNVVFTLNDTDAEIVCALPLGIVANDVVVVVVVVGLQLSGNSECS